VKNHPNGWVYILDKEFDGKEKVPQEFIRGTWKVDKNGIIVEEFIPNPNYSGNEK
jgi:hypothetical protein